MTEGQVTVASPLIHPMRYMRTRPFAEDAVRAYMRSCGRGMPTSNLIEIIGDLIVSAFNLAIEKVPREKRPQRATSMVTQEGSLAVHVGRYSAFGRNIYVMSPNLLAMLDHTDLDSVRVRDIRLPFDAFHISFADNFDGSLPGPPNCIDGAYVSRSGPDRLEIVVTSRRLDAKPNDSRRWPFSRDLYYYAPLDTSNGERTFAEILDRAIGIEIKIAADAIEPDPDMLADLPNGEAVSVHDVRHLTEAEQASYNSEGLPVFRRALALLVNGLCYMTAEPQDTHVRLPDDAPANLVADISQGTRGHRNRAKAQLLQRGFSFLHIIGGAISSSTRQDGAGAGSEVLSHWRRGHWRRQPHGPARAEVRLVWIKPTLVRADRGDPQHGHLYQVDRDRTAGDSGVT